MKKVRIIVWPSLESYATILCSKVNITDDEYNKLQQTVNSPDFNWDNFLEWVNIHKLEGFVSKHINYIKNNIKISDDVLKKLNLITLLYNIRGNLNINEALNLIKLFNANNIKVVLLKGPWLSVGVYHDFKFHPFGDIDLLINSNDYSYINELLKKNGYNQLEFVNGKPVKMNEELLNRYKNSLQHYGEYYKGSNNKYLPWYQLDVHTRFNTVYDSVVLDVKRMLNDSIQVYIKGTPVFVLSNVDHLIQQCYHFYWHTRSIKDIENFNDLVLLRFADIYESIKSLDINWNHFIDIVNEEQGLKLIINYVFSICERAYGLFIPEVVSEKIKINNIDSFINSVSDRWTQDSDIVIGHWDEPIEKRLFDKQRRYKAYEVFYKYSIEKLERKRGHQRYYYNY